MKKLLSILVGALLVVSIVSLCGCVNNQQTTTEKSTNNQQTTTEKPTNNQQTTKTIIIRTTGATFPKAQIEKWIRDYQKVNPNVKIEYEGGGSGHGQDAFLKGLTDIGRTDPPVKKEMWEKFLSTGDQPLQFPEIVGAVVVTYNVPEIGNAQLKLTPKVIADIYQGKIEYWDDEAIKKLNPGLADKLPHEKIIVIYRSDASGTTAIFSTFLNIAGGLPDNLVGKSVQWPVEKLGRGIGAKGNPGVINALKSTKYSIAYTELSYTIENNLPNAAIMNKKGKFVAPTDESIKAAVSGVKANIPDPTEGYKEDLKQMLNSPNENAYPIVAFTHLLVWENKNGKHYSPEKAKAIKEFLKWVLTEGQKPEHIAPGYVGLPSDVAKIGLDAINKIKE
ncbi:phosphate ABC transporter substrate-binding protein PstS [Methanotorris igneus]|uniref:Phosphate-binding protein n=1 Tax=Methanotorris igneus (strain DSM 5666 / JCM 11834 / Kol 5) TaxID=880724 RepID=F6BAM1_METIK|nr:phosphate ABC transporter substrate-binding protein PstS [Methanotorris igneus]AEF95835.1 phosphate ABC transporter, periplasmic phosphate-binding protein [Methanotorris igneus Kol 5]